MLGIEEEVKRRYRKHFLKISPDWEGQVERIVGLTIQLLGDKHLLKLKEKGK